MPAPDRQPFLNSHPLEREANRFLRLANVEIDPTSSNLMQLLQWGVTSGGLKLPNQDWRSLFLGYVDQLQAASPKVALDYLRKNPDDPENPFLRLSQLRSAMSPKEAAKVVFSALDLALARDPNVEDYPPNKYRTY